MAVWRVAKMNNRKRTCLLLFLLLFLAGLLLIFTVRPVCVPVSQEMESIRDAIREQKYIIHAGGALKTQAGNIVIYTNSLDALQNMYDAGNRFCEIDMRETSDGVLVCAHGDESYLANGSDLPATATAKEFEQEHLFNEFTPMTLDTLASFMHKHPELYIISDAQGDNLRISEKLARGYPDLRNRFIIQIYHESEFDPIRALGFHYIIYTLYRAEDEERNLWRIANFVETHELVGITIQCDQFYNMKNRVAMAHCGAPFMFHTVDDITEMEKMLREPFVIAVYTNLTF